MGFKDFWNRMTGGDKLQHVEEELETDHAEQPEREEDYVGMKDDVAVGGTALRDRPVALNAGP